MPAKNTQSERISELENRLEELENQQIPGVFKTIEELREVIERQVLRYTRRFGQEGKACRHCGAPTQSENLSPYCSRCDRVL